jgi:hypothetical protein
MSQELLKERANSVSTANFSDPTSTDSQNLINEIKLLRSRLKKAVNYIASLMDEKQHLIGMNNQLRGQINRIKSKLIFFYRFNKI